MKKIFTFAVALLASLSMMAANGTYSNMTVSGDTTKWDFGAATTGSSVKIPSGTVDNRILFISSSLGNQQLASSGGLSNKAESELYFPVSSATATGKIEMTVFSTSDSRWLQLFVGTENAGESKRLWSKYNETVTSDGKKGPQSFEFTSADLTAVEGVYYLKLVSNNTEMKIATMSVIEETGVRYTVTYMDGETVLGTEKVKEGENATKASTYEAKAHATFNGWYEDAALTTPATLTGISANKTVYGKWTADAFNASTSVNIEQLVLDNGKGYDIAGAFAAAHIAYANIDALDSLNSSSTANNEPFLGLKLKTAGAYVEMGLAAGDVLRVKFGNVADDVKINGATVAKADIHNVATGYTYTAAAQEYVRIETTTKNTVVLKQIMINDTIQDIHMPAVLNDATLATLTLDGVAIEGFAANKKEYTVTLAAGTTLPVVAATAHDANATVGTITQATTLPGDATFTVTAADGTTTATYTLHFVLPREISYLTAPYETSIPADFELPDWLAGCTVNLAYAGADTVVAGYDVIRFEKTDTVSMYVENVDSVIVDLSATGDRTVAIAVDGEEKANSGKFGKNTIKTLGAYIHSEGQVIVNIYGVNVGGGTTISRIKLTEYGSATPTGINNLEAAKAIKVIENGQIVIIKNGVRYNAVGAKL